ncbi:hypothetical protein GCM10020254_59330 [Streptomyces goshikiensis]
MLGRIATLSDPAHRADVLAHQPLTPRDPDPGEDSVDVALHLRGFTVQQLAEAIARRLSLPRPPDPGGPDRGGREGVARIPPPPGPRSWTASTRRPPTRPTRPSNSSSPR